MLLEKRVREMEYLKQDKNNLKFFEKDHKTKIKKNTLRSSSEIENWVLKSNFIESKIENDILGGASLADFEYDPNNLYREEEFNKKRLKVLKVLREVKLKKLSRMKNKSENETSGFDNLMWNLMSANFKSFNCNCEKEKYASMTKIEQIKFKKDERKKSDIDFGKEQRLEKLRSLNSGHARLMPGNLPQNITMERILFKDLFKLSKQRFSHKKDTDLLKKDFFRSQVKKGLLCAKTKLNVSR